MYKRKTYDEYQIQSLWSNTWEVVTIEDNFKDAREQVKCYRLNEPHIQHKIVKRRVKCQN